MAQLVELKCLNCGATLQVEADRNVCFCTYCGTKAVLNDGSVTTHIIDEAKIREAEALEAIKIREMELEAEIERLKQEKEAQSEKDNNKYQFGLIALMMVGGIAMIIILHFIGIL